MREIWYGKRINNKVRKFHALIFIYRTSITKWVKLKGRDWEMYI